MTTKCMIKLKLVMMKFIILVILKLHANDLNPLSYAPTSLPIGLHPFQLDSDWLCRLQ
jgi:hypothetical protein